MALSEWPTYAANICPLFARASPDNPSATSRIRGFAATNVVLGNFPDPRNRQGADTLGRKRRWPHLGILGYSGALDHHLALLSLDKMKLRR